MNDAPLDFVFACTLEDLETTGRFLLRGRHRPVLLVRDQGRIFALDNRCPHMGFPLDRGGVDDGILTCHWHHACFDLASGCAFDLWADDVPTCPVEVRGEEVWVKPAFGHTDPVGHWSGRLEDGMGHNLGLVIAKAIRGLLAAGVAPLAVLRQAALFGARNRDSWGTGMTVLTALGNLLPVLPEEDVYLALFQGVRRVANDCEGEAPRLDSTAMAKAPDSDTVKRWFRRWCAVRHRSGAERTLHTAVAARRSIAGLADLLFTAEIDRVFADGGHSLDFTNKAFECLDLIGWEHAAAVLPAIVGQMVAARGAEESPHWRQPVDLVALLETCFAELPVLWAEGEGKALWRQHTALAEALLGDDPIGVMDSLKEAIRSGAAPTDVSRALAYAAAMRIARFGTSNEHADWETAHHTFTYCNALHQAIKRVSDGRVERAGYTELVRGLFHGAVAVYLTRYLNVPPARIPGDMGDRLDDLPADPEVLRRQLLNAFDRQQEVAMAARVVARYLLLGYPPEPLVATLARALLREDAGFHAFQMLEAGVRQFQEWGNSDPGRHILVGVARYLAAHSPTERAAYQTADIARRLLGGRALHEQPAAD